jgi:hypothetical protein
MTILALFSMKSVNILAYYFLSCFHQATITSPRILTSIATACSNGAPRVEALY